jgi:hypothetical protein
MQKMFRSVKETLTTENIIPFINAGKLFIQKLNDDCTFPIGNADNIILSYAPSYNGRQATHEDVPFLMGFNGIEVHITPVEMPESTFAEGITA